MSVETASTFACESCGREFRWKAAIAGKSAKCGCGSAVKVPETDPSQPRGGAVDEEENIFGALEAVVAAAPVTLPPPTPVREEPKKPRLLGGKKSTPAMAAGGAKSAANPRFHQRTSVGLSKEEMEDMRNLSFWGHPKERTVPLITLGVSMLVFFGVTAMSGKMDGEGLLFWTIYSVLCAVGLTGAAFVTAGVAGMSFGVMGIGIVRLLSISYACLAMSALCHAVPYAVYISGILTYAIFTFGLIAYFGLEYSETRVVAFVATVLKIGLFLAALFIVAKLAPAKDDGEDLSENESGTPAMVAPEKAGDTKPTDVKANMPGVATDKGDANPNTTGGGATDK